MKDLLDASLMASIVAVQPQQHMVSEPPRASPTAASCRPREVSDTAFSLCSSLQAEKG
jgi:hypothetical protein